MKHIFVLTTPGDTRMHSDLIRMLEQTVLNYGFLATFQPATVESHVNLANDTNVIPHIPMMTRWSEPNQPRINTGVGRG